MRNGDKSPKKTYSAMVEKWKSDPESTCGSRLTPKFNHFLRVTTDGRTDRQTDRTNDHITPPSSNLRQGQRLTAKVLHGGGTYRLLV